MKKSSFVKFLFYSLMLIASVIYVLISINGPSDSVDDFALKRFDHDLFMNQLSVSMPIDLYKNDAWGNKSELNFVSLGFYVYSMTTTKLTSHAPSLSNYEYSITTAALTSCAPSLGFFFSVGHSFSSSSIQASYYDNQNNRGRDEKNNFSRK